VRGPRTCPIQRSVLDADLPARLPGAFIVPGKRRFQGCILCPKPACGRAGGTLRKALPFLLLLLGCAGRHVTPPNIAAPGAEASQTLAPRAFTYGPGDRIDVKVWRHDELDMSITIGPDGEFFFPLVGRVHAVGMTCAELVSALEQGLKGYYTDASVAVNVLAVNNQKVFVLGEVRTPAVLQIENDLSIVEALTRTGGINPDARTSNVLLIRGGIERPQLFTVNVDAIFRQGDMSQLVYLQRGDIVVVPSKTITNVERFFRRMQSVIAPFVGGSAVYRNSISGGAQGTSSFLQ
jgi:polysaccharide biosynthesis/export protein